MNTRKSVSTGRSVVIALAVIIFCYWAWPVTIPLLNRFRDYSLPHVLKTMDGMGICNHVPAMIDGQPGGISGSTIAVLDPQHNPEMFDVLRQSSGFHSIAQHPDWDFTFYVRDFEGKHWTDYPGPFYYYCSQTGELGRDKEWCYVPAAFRAWMKTLPKPHHDHYQIIRTPYYDNVQEVK